jgi:hypothetical protein
LKAVRAPRTDPPAVATRRPKSATDSPVNIHRNLCGSEVFEIQRERV